MSDAANGPATSLRLVAGLAVAWAAVRAAAALTWLRHPFPLEWQEGAMYEHSARVAEGLPVYQAPAVDFTAFPYPPLFHWVGSLLVTGPGAGLPALRIVSALASIAVLGCLFAAGKRRGGVAAGLLSAGLFVASEGWSGTWLLLARVDALFLALTAGSLLLGTSRAALGGSALAGALAGVLGALAVLAKQVALGPLAALVAGLLLRRPSRRAGLAAGLAAGALLAAVTVALERSTEGWFGFHVVGVLAGSPWFAPAARGFPVEVLLAWAPLLVLWLLAAPERAHPAERLALLALVAVAWVGRAHEGGYLNTLLPAALALAWVGGPLAARAAASWPRLGPALAGALLIWLPVAHPPAAPPGGAEAAAALAERIAGVDGQVWQPHGTLDPRSRGGVHAMALVDLLKSREVEAAARLRSELSRALDERRFSAIVLGVELSEWAELEALGRNYRVVDRLAPEGGASPVPATGSPIGPRLWLEPR